MNNVAESHWTSRRAAVVAPSRRLDLVTEELDGEAVLVDPRNGCIHRLNASAWDVWLSCDGRRTTRQIAQQLSRKYEVASDRALDCVDQLMPMFAERGLFDLCRSDHPDAEQ